VRDVLAWLRLLVDPHDASAVVRALARPPVELRQVDLARVIQVARRRKLDLVVGLQAATESPHVPPEARERIERFVELHRGAAAELDALAPEVFIARLVDRLGAIPGRTLLAPEDLARRRAGMEGLKELAEEFLRSRPLASARELARHLATSAPAGPAAAEAVGPAGERPGGARVPIAAAPDPAGAATDAQAPGADPADSEGGAQEPSDRLAAALQLLRAEVLAGVGRIGGRLAELRLDTDLDISHGVVGYLELLKLSALAQRRPGESLEEALEDINLRLLAATTPLQREILQTSTLDQTLLAEGGLDGASVSALARREEHSLVPFLPRKGAGLALSASDIETYRSCPLRYKFARVLRIPSEQTISQRFGIAVHQVLERYHSEEATDLGRLLELLDAGLRRSGIPSEHRELREKARTALTRYHARMHEDGSQPVWFERAFSFRLGPHHLRGRVDRVDRLGGEGEARYELIDYKTSRPKSPEQLRDDVQLSLYALAAREDWLLESSSRAYYYVLDDVKVAVPAGVGDPDAVSDTVLEVGEGILAQAFEPTPSPSACALCDYRIVCPAAEA
jgi:CRISPR/Cas system-associated exonuclease Cas4 (RecB family)